MHKKTMVRFDFVLAVGGFKWVLSSTGVLKVKFLKKVRMYLWITRGNEAGACNWRFAISGWQRNLK
jgi:hypothetical protein